MTVLVSSSSSSTPAPAAEEGQGSGRAARPGQQQARAVRGAPGDGPQGILPLGPLAEIAVLPVGRTQLTPCKRRCRPGRSRWRPPCPPGPPRPGPCPSGPPPPPLATAATISACRRPRSHWSAGTPQPTSSAGASVSALALLVRLSSISCSMPNTLMRCPVGRTSSDIVVVVTSMFPGGDLLPALPATTVPPPPPA